MDRHSAYRCVHALYLWHTKWHSLPKHENFDHGTNDLTLFLCRSDTLKMEIKTLVGNFFRTSSSCRSCPREVVAHNPSLAHFHDACSCESDFTNFNETSAYSLQVLDKKGFLTLTFNGTSYSLPWRSFTHSTYVKAKTKKYCQKNDVLCLLSPCYFVNPGPPTVHVKNTISPAGTLIAVKIVAREHVGQDPGVMYRITWSKDTRGLALVKNMSYRVSLVYEGKSGEATINGRPVSAEKDTDDTAISPNSATSKPNSPSDITSPGNFSPRGPALDPAGQSIDVAQAWLSANGFGSKVCQHLIEFTDGDLCALSKGDAKELLGAKDGIRLVNLLRRSGLSCASPAETVGSDGISPLMAREATGFSSPATADEGRSPALVPTPTHQSNSPPTDPRHIDNPNKYQLYGPVDADTPGQKLKVFVRELGFSSTDILSLRFCPQQLTGPSITVGPSGFRALEAQSVPEPRANLGRLGIQIDVPLAHPVWHLVAQRFSLENSFPVVLTATISSASYQIGVVLYQFRTSSNPLKGQLIKSGNDAKFWEHMNGIMKFFGNNISETNFEQNTSNSFYPSTTGTNGGQQHSQNMLDLCLDLIAFYSEQEAFQTHLRKACDRRCSDPSKTNTPDEYGFTILHYVTFLRQESLVNRCLIHGADPTVQDKTYKLTPLDLARMLHSHTEMYITLKKASTRTQVSNTRVVSGVKTPQGHRITTQRTTRVRSLETVLGSVESLQQSASPGRVTDGATTNVHHVTLTMAPDHDTRKGFAEKMKSVPSLFLTMCLWPIIILPLLAISSSNLHILYVLGIPALMAFTSLGYLPLFVHWLKGGTGKSDEKSNALGPKFMARTMVVGQMCVWMLTALGLELMLALDVEVTRLWTNVFPTIISMVVWPLVMRSSVLASQMDPAERQRFKHFLFLFLLIHGTSMVSMFLVSSYVQSSSLVQVIIILGYEAAYEVAKTMAILASGASQQITSVFWVKQSFRMHMLMLLAASSNILVFAAVGLASIWRFVFNQTQLAQTQKELLQQQRRTHEEALLLDDINVEERSPGLRVQSPKRVTPFTLHYQALSFGTEITADVLATFTFCWLLPALYTLPVASALSSSITSLALPFGLVAGLTGIQSSLLGAHMIMWNAKYGRVQRRWLDLRPRTLHQSEPRATEEIVEGRRLGTSPTTAGMASKTKLGATEISIQSLGKVTARLARDHYWLGAAAVVQSVAFVAASTVR